MQKTSITLRREEAEELTDIAIRLGFVDPKDREKKVQQYLKPRRVLIGGI